MKESDHKVIDFWADHLISFFMLGVVCGAIYFDVNSVTTSVFEAIITPIAFGVAFGFISIIIAVLFQIVDLYVETDRKKLWCAGIVTVIAIIICVVHVL